jgi:hypothetical protein
VPVSETEPSTVTIVIRLSSMTVWFERASPALTAASGPKGSLP